MSNAEGGVSTEGAKAEFSPRRHGGTEKTEELNHKGHKDGSGDLVIAVIR
ncbi:MAG TPA: hypothetical protein VGJ51_16540 [Candidatus Angelobacter sp.]